MGDYVSPFSSGGGKSAGGGTPRNPGAGYVSPKMAGYVSPLSTKNYNIAAPPDPMKSGFSAGGKKYKNIDDYVAQFDKLAPAQRLQTYNSLKGSNDPLSQSIHSNLDQKGRSQTVSTGQHALNAAKDVGHGISATGRFLLGGTAKLVNQGYQEGKQVVDTTKMITANATGNSDAFSNANKQSEKDYKGFQKGKGGILGVGTLSSEKSAKAGELKQGAKDIGGGTLMAAGELLPAAKGLGIAAKGEKFVAGGVEAEKALRAAEAASQLTKGEKAAQLAIAGGKRLAINGAYGAVGSTGSQLATNGKVNPFQVAKDAGASAATGEIVHAGGALLGKVFSRGSDAALKDAVAARKNVAINPDTIDAAAKDIPKDTGQKLLPAGNIQNNSESIVKGTPAVPGDAGTPSKVPVSEAEYKQRFDSLSKSYDSGMKAAQAQKGSLAQSIAADQVHEDHLNALNQLDHEFQNGKANPDFRPATSGTAATPDTKVQSGFQIVNPDQGAVHVPVIANDGRAQLHQRVGQIDSIIKDAQNHGTTRTPEELRGLMRERQAAQGVLDGTHTYQEVYGKPAGDIKDLPFGDKAVADAGHKPGDTMPTKDTPVAPGSSMFTTLPTVAAGDTKAPELHRAFVAGQYDKLGSAIQDAQKGMTPHDVKLIESIESPVPLTSEQAAQRVADITKTANDPEKFGKAVAALKEFSDARLANDTALGRDVSKRENYLSRFYQRGTTAQSKALDRLNLTGDALPGYTKTRSIATQAEADALAAMKNADGTPKYPQLQRANANVFEDAKQAVDMAKADHGKQAVKLALEQAHPGTKVGVNKIGFDPESGLTYKGLNTKGGNGLSLPQHLADEYNKRAPVTQKTTFGIKLPDGSIQPVRDNELVQQLKATPGSKLVDPVTGKDLHNWKINKIIRSAVKDPLGTYDKVNANLKYSILGGGTFHAVTTGGTVAGQQAMRALTHPLKIPSMISDNLKLVAGTVSQKSHDAVMAHHEADGSLGFAKLAGATLSPKEILGDANPNWVDHLKDSRWNPIKQIHDAVFARQIPEAKMMILKQSMQSKFKGMDFNNPTAEQVKYGRNVASAVNNLGGINRAVEGLSPATAKKLSRVLLATDFTEGKFRIIGNALTKGGPKGNIARQMVVGKSILFALPGLAALTASGQLDWSKPDQVRKAITDQILDPSIPLSEKGAPTKSNPQGTNQAIHFPSTFISEFGKIVKPALDPLATDKTKGAKDYLTNRLAAAPAIGSRLYQNKDFQGNPIYGTDKNGNPISSGKTALNIANQVAPIPVVQGAKKAGGQSTRDTALNIAGLRVSSDPNAASGQHTKAIQDFYTTLNSASSQHTKTSKQISLLLSQNNPAQAYRVAQQYNDSLPQRLQPFREKYNDHYNPAWDTEFKKLEIPLTANSFKSRQKSNALQSSILDPNY